ncbi:pilus assembly protein [Halovulum dunhuangense]|uniref:Pilus assembly protein n=1 Tax=Halovulum dunhuangense TaxID=1505036 RepID=A0A849KZC5_9RHOB|nr:pilus assembly protein [Halovulum dunhuangense]
MTVEFVIIFPMLMGFLLLVFTASMFIATISEVQQLSFELARASLVFFDQPDVYPDFCQGLLAERLDVLADNFSRLEPGRIADVNCSIDPVSSLIEVSVDYDFEDDFLSRMGRLIGLELQSVTRRSILQV